MSDTLNYNKQASHIEGSSKGKSYIYGDLNDAETLYNSIKGTGQPIFDDEMKRTNKEHVICDKIIGVHIDFQGISNESREVIVIYSKTGSHIYPGKEK